MLTAVLLSNVGGPNDVSAPCDSPVPGTRTDTLGSPAPNVYCFPFRAENAPFADWSVLVTCPVGTEHVTECRALIGSRRKGYEGREHGSRVIKAEIQAVFKRLRASPTNKNAFFHQHGAPTSDTNAKYNSRSAQM
ncbi:hypothetical protein XENTR_v10010999 [Xenopus tropicalis]|nr:hypothetical protein XENTR_v10010999 [Xenopus tropicalis]KAE8607084.1 hypothetical protein XENTR_v10010999 [Xenopus tropicalis]